MVYRTNRCEQGVVCGAQLDGEGALGGGGEDEVVGKALVIGQAHAEPVQPRCGEDDAVEVTARQPGQSRIDVAPHRHRDEIGSTSAQLRRTAR